MTEDEIVKLRQQAADEGYTEEEIQQYIDSQQAQQAQQAQPKAAEPKPMDRKEEYIGMAQAGGLEGLKTVAEVGVPTLVAKKYIYDPLMNRGAAPPAAPVAPAAAPPAGSFPRGPIGPSPAQQTFQALSKDYGPAQQMINPQAFAEQKTMPQQASQPPTAANFIDRMHGLAEKYKTANPVVFKQPTTNKAPAMRTPGGGMEGGPQPIQIQQGPDIAPELRRYKEQNIYNTFR